MAHQKATLKIDQGPSKLDLMLSVFDTDMGPREIKFRVSGQLEHHPDPSDIPGWCSSEYSIQLVSARRRHPTATIWELEGFVKTPSGKKRVAIYYLSDTRTGRMRFEKNLRTDRLI